MDLQIIRGARILQQLERETLEERDTFQGLERRTIGAFPRTTRRQHSTHPVRIVRVDLTPYLGTNNLLIRGLARSGTRANIYYKPILFFNDVNYHKPEQATAAAEEGGEEIAVPAPVNFVTFKASDGQDYHMEPINLAKNVVRVRCDCLDFYFRFAPWDFSNDDLYGPKPKPYVRKTNTRPPVNPTRSPGVCKHIMKLVLSLRDSGMLQR